MPMITVFVPKSIVGDPRKLARAVANALDGAMIGAQADFQVTTQTWEHQPTFTLSKPNEDTRIVSTDDAIYGYVNFGTKPHIIVPRNGKVLTWIGGNFKAKTRPRVIGSNKGSNKGNTIVYTKLVQHPGNEAREFDETIAKKWCRELPKTMQRAIDAEL